LEKVLIRYSAVPVVLIVVGLAASSLGGCGLEGASAGGRPFVYKQGPGDPPSTIEEKAGVVAKRETPPAAPVSAPAPSAAAPPPRAATPQGERLFGPAPSVAAATSAAPAASAGSVAADATGGYTQATRYGDLLFLSGQIALDRTGNFPAGQNIEAQTRQAMENVRAILENNRLTMANIVAVTIYLTAVNDLAAVDRVYHGFFKGTPPARSVVEVSHLPRGALIEVSVVAGR
jgi:2-iminobutanoate/2-iminopropanoate deaminase